MALFDTGREAVEYLINLRDQPLDKSFPVALDTLEMLSNVQTVLKDFENGKWREDTFEAIQAVVWLFRELADAYETGNEGEYYHKLQDIYLVYLESYDVVTRLITARCNE